MRQLFYSAGPFLRGCRRGSEMRFLPLMDFRSNVATNEYRSMVVSCDMREFPDEIVERLWFSGLMLSVEQLSQLFLPSAGQGKRTNN